MTIGYRNALLAYLVVFAVLSTTSVLTFLNLRTLESNETLVRASHEELGALNELLLFLVNAETGMRGFVVTGEDAFLEPYHEAERRLIENVHQAIERGAAGGLGGSSVEATQIEKLQNQVKENMAWFQQVIDLRRSQGMQPAVDLVKTGEGKRRMDATRQTADGIRRDEELLLEQRARESAGSHRTAVISLLVSTLLGLILTTGGYFLLRRDFQTRESTAAALQLANSQLEARVMERTASIQQMNQSLRDEVEERSKAELQARNLAVELQRSNSELEQFASVASHDLQEPLRKIQAFGDRLNAQFREVLGDKGKDYLDRVMASAARMRVLIDDLLAFSRIASKAQPFVPVSLKRIAAEVVDDLEGRIQKEQGEVSVGSLPEIQADPMQMRQLLQNLIGNALKFRKPEAPPRVEVSSRLLSPAEHGQEMVGELCEITIKDNGVGFEQVYANRIFELFQRLHGRNEYEGTGMGLAICRKIVERHGGSIVAESSPGVGTTFTIVLPVVHKTSGEPA